MAFLTFLFVPNVLSTSQRSIYLSFVITRCWKIVHHKLFIDIIKFGCQLEKFFSTDV